MSTQNLHETMRSIIDATNMAPQNLENMPEDCKPFVIVPDGYRVEDLTKYLVQPPRIERNIELHDVDSFVRYISDFGEDTTRIFADLDSHNLTAIVDYHQPDDPSWCGHTAHFPCTLSNEWREWFGKNRKKMSQGEYANWIDINLSDITTPTAATMLETVLDISQYTDKAFKSRISLHDGQVSIHYAEEIRAKDGKSSLELPQEFVLTIPIFKNGEPVSVTAKQRVRVKDAELVLWYELVQPEKITENAFKAICQQVGERLPGVELLAGKAGK